MSDNKLLEEMLVGWPNCTTPDCEHKQCTWSGTPFCFPCAERWLGHAEMVRLFDATHDLTWEETKRLETAEDAVESDWEMDDDAD